MLSEPERDATGYKFELVSHHVVALAYDYPDAMTTYAEIGQGHMTINRGTRWDGPSSLTLDTVDWMWASLVHDMLYRMIADGLLPASYRRTADDEMLAILKEYGMPWWRRWYSWAAVRVGGWAHARK